MTNPAALIEAIGNDAASLDEIEKAMAQVHILFLDAEDAWQVAYDEMADTLKEEYAEAGRKSDPAEHVIVTETRRKHRDTWRTYRRAKKALDSLSNRLSAKRAALNGRQSQLAALRDETRASGYSPSVQWSERPAA